MAYTQTRAANPGALSLTIGLNAAAVVALMAWNPRIVGEVIDSIPLINIREPEPPPPPPPQTESETRPHNRIDHPQPKVSGGTAIDDWATTEIDHGTLVVDPGKGGDIVIPPQPPPTIHEPVRKSASMAMSAGEMQPPYPPALQRAEVQGSVTVRVLVGSDGRPRDIVLVRADDPGFFAAARSWGLRHWRFKPASEDGTAVDGWFTLTVRFTMT